MGGKGGGGSDYYVQPPDTSGYGTLEEAEKTLAKNPIDLSSYQQNINAKKVAAQATAPEPPKVLTSQTKPPVDDTGATLAKSVLKPPDYWTKGEGLKPRRQNKSAVETTQT